MKRVNFILLLSALALLMLVAFGCGGSNDENNDSTVPTGIEDITPAQADWVLAFGAAGTKAQYFVTAYWIGGLNPPDLDDVAELYANGEQVDLISLMPGFWMGEMSATEGATYTIKFVYNGETKTETSLKMVYTSQNTDFPEPYDPTQPATFDWELAGNNDHQVAGVTATKIISEDEEWTDEYSREISTGARTFTVPANAIDNVPDGADYALWVSQVNFKFNNRTALMSLCTSQSGSLKQNPAPAELKKQILRTYNLLAAETE